MNNGKNSENIHFMEMLNKTVKHFWFEDNRIISTPEVVSHLVQTKNVILLTKITCSNFNVEAFKMQRHPMRTLFLIQSFHVILLNMAPRFFYFPFKFLTC